LGLSIGGPLAGLGGGSREGWILLMNGQYQHIEEEVLLF